MLENTHNAKENNLGETEEQKKAWDIYKTSNKCKYNYINNVNRLNNPMKRERSWDQIKQQDLTICSLQETHLKFKSTNIFKVKGQKKIHHAHRNHKKTERAILISDSIDFKTKKITKDKEVHFIMIIIIH